MHAVQIPKFNLTRFLENRANQRETLKLSYYAHPKRSLPVPERVGKNAFSLPFEFTVINNSGHAAVVISHFMVEGPDFKNVEVRSGATGSLHLDLGNLHGITVYKADGSSHEIYPEIMEYQMKFQPGAPHLELILNAKGGQDTVKAL